MSEPKRDVEEEPMNWWIENDFLYYVHKTGSKHRLSKVVLVGNKDKEVVIILKRNKDTPYTVHSDLCFKKNIPSDIDESDIRYFDNDIIWFVVEPPFDDVNRSIIAEMNESLIPLIRKCFETDVLKINEKFKQYISNETKQALEKMK